MVVLRRSYKYADIKIMDKLLIQLTIIVATFFGTWWSLQQIDWMQTLQVEKIGKSTEEKLGKLYWDVFKRMEDEEKNEKIIAPVDSLLYKICTHNGINYDQIKLHIVNKDEINAFALPDHHLVLYTGLIRDCKNEAELCGVLAHELAHMENGHIMEKLVKEIGLSMVISMTAGKGNPDMIHQAVKIMSSTAYDRSLESEADLTGVDYLINANIDPEAFAGFLYRMSEREEDLPREIFWLTTHPGSEERTKAIINYIAGKHYQKEMILDSLQWEGLKSILHF